MKKRILAIIVAVVLCLSVVTTASAKSRYIIDDYNYIGSSDVSKLEKKAQDIEDTYGYSVMLCITESINTETNYDYAQAIYEENSSSDKGLILLHNTQDAVYVFYVTPNAESLFSEAVQKEIGDAYNQSETYAEGASEYLNFAEKAISGNESGKETSTESVPVEREVPLVVDNADVLTADEENKLNSKLAKLSEEHKAEIAVLTITDLEGKTPQAYADDYYDYGGYGYGKGDDGMLVLFKTDPEELHITTYGKAVKSLTDGEIEKILYSMKDLIVAEKYFEAFDLYADMCSEQLKPPTVSWVWIPICLVVGFVVAFIISKIVESSLRTVRTQKNATNYVRQGSMNLTEKQDIFLYRNVTHTAIEKDDDNDNDNYSSTHTSSSGREHGGGGISF